MASDTQSEIFLSPSGRLLFQAGGGGQGTWAARVEKAFAAGPEEGLFTLAAAGRPEGPLSPSLAFWREIAGRYVTELCRTPEFSGDALAPVEAPGPDERMALVFGAPPMQGGEYLTQECLGALWESLDAWVRGRIADSGKGLSGWIAANAPRWHQVGRVCFHLAENRRDPEFPFAFLATYAPSLSAGGRIQYQPLGLALKEYAGQKNRKALIHLLSPVQRASERSPFVKELVDSGDLYHPIAWPPGEAYRLLKDVPVLEESGLLVRLPDWWRKRPRPQVSVTVGEKRQSRLGGGALLDFKVDLVLGGERLTEEERRALLQGGDGLVSLRGQWVEVDRERLAEALAHFRCMEVEAGHDGISFIQAMRLLAGAPRDLEGGKALQQEAGAWAFVNPGAWLTEVLAGLRDPSHLPGAGEKEGFRGVLRPYQETGENWLWFLTRLGLGACLADDMGLGKTVQVLSLLLRLRNSREGRPERPSLLLLPASLLSNWKAEIRRFVPDLETCFLHPSELPRSDLEAMAADPERAFSGKDLVLTTYGMLLRQEWLWGLAWHLVILDEAQAVKNPGTRQSRAVKRLKNQARIALTGTPVENRLSDLWSLFDFLCPGLLGSVKTFTAFVKRLEEGGKDRYAPLRRLVGPYILRRMKTDRAIVADLPEKTEMKAYCGLSRRQAVLYSRTVEEMARALEGEEGIRRRGLVLSFLMRFKQICNHPSQVTGDGAYAPQESGKFERLGILCEEIGSRQEKVLVFTQFREITEPIATFLAGVFGREGLVLHGGTEVKQRRSLIETFDREDGPPFFVLSLKAGGTGLNLTAANHVIHFDRWWNPAVENQATDRAFRIGQKRNVLVHAFLCRGTVEEKIDALMEEKRGMAEGLLEAGAERLLTEMGNEELLRVVALDIERASL